MRLHTAAIAAVWSAFLHPPYSPDLAPNDFHLLKFLGGMHMGSDEDKRLVADSYDADIQKLIT